MKSLKEILKSYDIDIPKSSQPNTLLGAILKESKLFFRPWIEVKPYALPIRSIGGIVFENTPEDAYTWDDFDQDIKSRWPIRFYLFDTLAYTIKHKWNWYIIENIWKIKYRFISKHKYHIINTGLKPGYYDPSTTMLYSWMNLLKNFMEVGAPEIDWENAATEHADAWKDLKEIYGWWLNYDNRLKEIDEAYGDKEYVDTINKEGEPYLVHKAFLLEDTLDTEADEMLKLLAGVRRFIWYP